MFYPTYVLGFTPYMVSEQNDVFVITTRHNRFWEYILFSINSRLVPFYFLVTWVLLSKKMRRSIVMSSIESKSAG